MSMKLIRSSMRALVAAAIAAALLPVALDTTASAQSAPAAQADTTDTKSLLDRIAELEARDQRNSARNADLEARLASVEAEQNQKWMTQQRADEIRGLVQQVLADADTRASLLDSASMAGYDDGFFISSADGNWTLRTNLLMQERLVINRQKESPTDSSKWGFESARTNFTLSGNVLSPDWFYLVEIEVGNNDVGLESYNGLQQAFVGYDFGQGWRFWVGSFQTPLLREDMVSSSSQLAVERSVVDYFFTGGYTDGLAVEYRNNIFHVVGSYNNGITDVAYGGGVVTGASSGVFGTPATYSFTVRGEWLINGDWAALTSFTSPRDSQKAMMLGGAIEYQSGDENTTGVADLDLLVMTLDFTAQFSGASLFAGLIYANANGSPPASDGSGYGIVLQGGYYFTETWEGYARYEWGNVDEFTFDNISIFTIGVNKYFAGQNAKWSTDFGYAFDAVPVTVPIAGWRADVPGNSGQFVIRTQLQLMF